MKRSLRGAIAVAFLAPTVSSETDSTPEIVLQDNCRCLKQNELSPLEPATKFPYDVVDLRGYGVGCKSHDRYSISCIGNRDAGSWCKKPWCYVDSQNCALSNTHSIIHPNRFFSYAACGHIDTFTRDPHRLKGGVLKGVLHDNHRGYQGTYCKNSTDNATSCHGPLVDLAKYLVQEAGFNFTIDYTSVPESVTKIADNYEPFKEKIENERHGSCVYAAGMGTVDLCIGAFTKSRHRSAVAPCKLYSVVFVYCLYLYSTQWSYLPTPSVQL